MAEPTSSALTPLFAVRFGTPIWRLLPTPGGLVVELRDQVARTAAFIVLDLPTGRERARYHNPHQPWWLTVAGLRGATLYLDQLNPDQLGQAVRRWAVDLTTGNVRPVSEGESTGEPSANLRLPAVYTPASPYWLALTRFVAERTGDAPHARLEYLEVDPALVLAWDLPDADNQLMVCDAATGDVRLLVPLTNARLGPEAALFCIFGPILLALPAPDSLTAWAIGAP